MTTPRDVLLELLSHDATRPRLTWYGSSGERVELSARVLENWVAKAANLLVEEGDVGPGSTVRLDLPSGHWRAVYWALAAWSCGALLRLDDPDEEADVLVTADARRAAEAGADVRVLVTPAMLARSYPGELPLGVLDEAAELPGYGDRFAPDAEPEPSAPALVAADGRAWAYDDLFDGNPVEGVRSHIDATRGNAADRLRRLLAVWSANGSAVVTSGGGHSLEHLLAAEGVDEPEE